MVVVKVPSVFPKEVIDISVAAPRSIDNGTDCASRALRPLELAVVHLAAGLEMALGGTGLQLSDTGQDKSFRCKVAATAYAKQIEATILCSLEGGAADETLDLTLVTDFDATGQTQQIVNQDDGTLAAATVVKLRANLAAGLQTSKALDQEVTMSTHRSTGGTGTTRVFAYALRLIPISEVTIT